MKDFYNICIFLTILFVTFIFSATLAFMILGNTILPAWLSMIVAVLAVVGTGFGAAKLSKHLEVK